jgi:hypothetical protein
MNTIIEIFDNIRNNFKEFVTTCLFISFLLLVIYLLSCLYAHNVQSAVYSQDIPNNMICIKDTVPHAYLCSPDATIPWYLSSEGVLAHVQ